jgi:hypothetical protein
MNSIIDTDSRQTDATGYAVRLGHNPGGVVELAAVSPRVAEYSNPGLEDGSPSGKMSNIRNPLLTKSVAAQDGQTPVKRLTRRH